MKAVIALATLLLLPEHAKPAPASLASRIDAAISTTEAGKQTFWGICVTDLSTGKIVYARNEDRFFIPASNTKLFSTGLALTRLGPAHRFTTRVLADSQPDPNGRVTGLTIVGGGDPNLSARVMPYQHAAIGPNPLAAIEQLADTLLAKGVRTVSGGITGDDTAYTWEPFPDGWSANDPVWEYGAPVSALTVNDNAFGLTIAPSPTPGEPASLILAPPVEYLTVHNQTRTGLDGERTDLNIDRMPNSAELFVSGTIARNAQPSRQLLAVDDPALFAAESLRHALLARGVRIEGAAQALHRMPDDLLLPANKGVELAALQSLPLTEALKVVNKVSQNLHAEIMLREVARVRYGVGSRKGGLVELEAFLNEIGVRPSAERVKQYNIVDGSGLSRLTLVTPRTFQKLLSALYNGPHRDAWLATLPIGGLDGTLAFRFEKRRAEAASVLAKTGTISHVSALSGYARRKDGRDFAFTVIANNYNAPSSAIRKIIDDVALALLTP